MGVRQDKSRVYGLLARIGKAVGNPHRLEILDLLAQGERTVEAIAGAVALPVANASHHLQVLRAAGLVGTRRQGTFIHYRTAGEDTGELVRRVRDLAQRRLDGLERLTRNLFQKLDAAEPVDRANLLARMRSGEVLALDVRPAQEYATGHIAGAISVPLEELERRMAELPKGKAIVAYCRGPYCVLAPEAVRKLRGQGRVAWRLAGGFPEWRADGLPVTAGEEAA
jgi:rhodanese-related sulfurtransferase